MKPVLGWQFVDGLQMVATVVWLLDALFGNIWCATAAASAWLVNRKKRKCLGFVRFFLFLSSYFDSIPQSPEAETIARMLDDEINLREKIK